MTTVRVSVLDTSPIVQGSSPRAALENTLDLAKVVDQLGYYRYWVPEHHSMRGVASSAPAVLIARLGGLTQHLRIGSGGVLLPNHAPLIVAEQFGTLEALFPGRIDLGIGRAPGGPAAAAHALRRNDQPFTSQLNELLSYLDASNEQPVTAVPAVGNRPPVWLLGSTSFSAETSAAFGLSYAFAHHLKPDNAPEHLRRYRESFHPSPWCADSTTLLSVSVIAADTDQQAEWLAGSTRLKVLSRLRGAPILLPSPEHAAAYPYTADDRAVIAERTHGVIVGNSSTVRDRLQELLDHTGTTELMVTTPIYDHHDRVHSYALISELADSLTTHHQGGTKLAP